MAKFSGLKDLKRDREEHLPEQVAAMPQTQRDVEPIAPAAQPAPAPTHRVGKRNNPAYVQRTAYIRKTTDRAVKRKLFEQGEGKEFSELVDELLSQWVAEE